MSSNPIRLLVVDADPGQGGALLALLEEHVLRNEGAEGVELVGVARSQRVAIQLVETEQPDLLLVDLMLPGYRSINVIGEVTATQPEVRILALSPGDPPHDRIILAVQAGALGYVCRDSSPAEFSAAIHHVHQDERWLPLDATYEVLQDAAPELAVSVHEQRSRLTTVLLGLLPLAGLVAAITALMWREYWGQIGVRVVDLGVDPTTRVTDIFVSLLYLLGVFGPLLFVDGWLQNLGIWVAEQPGLSNTIARARSFHLGKLPIGKLVFSRATAWLLVALLVLSITLMLGRYADIIVVVFLGPAVAIVLLANILGMEDRLSEVLHLRRLGRGALAMLGILSFLFLLVLGGEVLIKGPDLRADGMHGILVPEVLGMSARPVMLYDLDGNFEPLGALYLGGNADLYVLYDPCTETVRQVPVGSSRVEVIEQVKCRSP